MFGKKEDFGGALYLLLFTMILNVVLKSIFQIPLALHLEKEGFAFPSGHMQSAAVFYGWLAYKTSSFSMKGLVLILLMGSGSSLVYFGYHTWVEVLGGIGFAALTVGLYIFLLRQLDSFNPSIIGAFFLSGATLLLGGLGYQREILPHVWMAYYALMGFSIAWGIMGMGGKLSWIKGLFGVLGCLIFIFLIQIIFQTTFFEHLPPYLFEMQWILSAGSIPCVVKMLSLFEWRHGNKIV